MIRGPVSVFLNFPSTSLICHKGAPKCQLQNFKTKLRKCALKKLQRSILKILIKPLHRESQSLNNNRVMCISRSIWYNTIIKYLRSVPILEKTAFQVHYKPMFFRTVLRETLVLCENLKGFSEKHVSSIANENEFGNTRWYGLCCWEDVTHQWRVNINDAIYLNPLSYGRLGYIRSFFFPFGTISSSFINLSLF